MTEISQSNSINISVNTNRHKIIFVGDAGVGKTTIINRINDNEYQSTYEATIGVDFYPKKINFRGNEITLQIWDTAGQEKYRGLIPSYIRNSSIVFIVFDITNRNTFESVPKWIELIRGIEKNILVLFGNKSDLKEKREVKKEEGKKLAEKNKILYYYEISAKEDNNIDLKKSFYNAVIDLPIFSNENKEKRDDLINELIKEKGENKKDQLNLNVKNLEKVDNTKKNQNDNNNNNNRDNYDFRYYSNNSNSSVYIIKDIENYDNKKEIRRGICPC